MTGSPSKGIALKTDVNGQEDGLFAGVTVHHLARTFYRLGAAKGFRSPKAVWKARGTP